VFGGAAIGDAEALLSRGTLFPPLAIWLAQTACEFVFVINACACAFVCAARVNGFENSWVRDVSRDDESSLDGRARRLSAADVYLCALYWAAATVSIVACGVTRESVVGGSTRARMCVARADRTRVYPSHWKSAPRGPSVARLMTCRRAIQRNVPLGVCRTLVVSRRT